MDECMTGRESRYVRPRLVVERMCTVLHPFSLVCDALLSVQLTSRSECNCELLFTVTPTIVWMLTVKEGRLATITSEHASGMQLHKQIDP